MLRTFLDYRRLVKWEQEVLNRGVRKESRSAKLIQSIPWTGVAMFAFMMIFFGVDLGVGIAHTASQMKQRQEDAKANVAVQQKYQSKQWSMEQVKNYREGEIPRPSYAEGGPREAEKQLL
jgi:hypothetical protein